jgi:aminopeptidase C
MDKALDNGKIIGIEYDAGILEDYNYAASVLNGHASSIIGRRFNEKTNSCEYLLRNSWGKSCAGYHEDYECEDGHIWMAESFFQYSPNIRRAVYFEGKK